MKIKKSVKTTALSLAMCALLCGSTISTLSLVPFSSSQAYAISSYTPNASAKNILNSVKLNPQKTGYKVIDDKVEALLSQFRKEGAKDTYSLVKASYDWIIKNTSYGGNIKSDSVDAGQLLQKSFGTPSYATGELVLGAYDVLFKGKGVCDDYTAAFVVMTRAIGLDSYAYNGQTRKVGGGYTGHAWVEININGNNYIFDTQVEDNVAGTGNIRYLYFCKTETQMKDSYIWETPSEIAINKKSYNPTTRLSENYDYVVSNLSELQEILNNTQATTLNGKTIAFRQTIDQSSVEKMINSLSGWDIQLCPAGWSNTDDHIKILSTDETSSDIPSSNNNTLSLNKTEFFITQKVGKEYLIIKGATDPSLVKFTSVHSSVNFKFLEKTSEGLKYEITTSNNFGETVYVSYQNKTSSITVNSVPISGSIMLDTINYKMSKGNIYDIGITITNGETKKLTGSQIKQLVDDGILRVTDSRSGSIVNLTQLSNGNFRVTGKNPGTCYIVYEIMSGNKAVTHASVRLDVENGVKQHGVATRNTSYWTPKLFSQYSW